ncbi:MAG: DUF5677 domain-containing protein [Pirellulaceae bacterium]|nr:DUF5677 domain-containing protein [Pirellulaceae bacterium]
MSLDETLFVGTPTTAVPLPLDEILEHYAVIRDALANTPHVESNDLSNFVANTSFVYALNAYKAISLLLPELYHESGAVVLRQLWEVSLNLHWVGVDPEPRAQDFCNFTLMEYRKLIQKSGDATPLQSFDDATERFQANFRYQDGRGRNRTHANFATSNIYDRAVVLGDPWEREYELVYHLTSMHAHGAPGAVLHGMFQAQYPNPEIRDRNSAALIAMLAIKVMVRNVELLVQLDIVPNATNVVEAFAAYQAAIAPSTDSTTDSEKPQ